MQLLLILGIIFAVGAVIFALQNNVTVTVTLAFWSFESTLAVVLLLTLGIGVLAAALIATPRSLRGQWNTARLRRQVALLEDRNNELERRLAELRAAAPEAAAELAVAEPKPYVGLKTLITGGSSDGAPR